MKRCILIATVFSCLATPSLAGLTEGIAAATAGNYAQALAEFEPLAAAGDPAGQYYLAKLYLEGHGPTNDVRRGVELMTKAAQGNYPEAQAQLGLMYAMGLGVKVDNALAYDWLTKAMAALPDGTRRTVAESNRDAVLQRMTQEQRNAVAVSTPLPTQPIAEAATAPEPAPATDETTIPQAEPAAQPAATVASAAAEPAPATMPKPAVTKPEVVPSVSDAASTSKPAATETASEPSATASAPEPTSSAAEPAAEAKAAATDAAATAELIPPPQPKPAEEAATSSPGAVESKTASKPEQSEPAEPDTTAETAESKPAEPAIVATGPVAPAVAQTTEATTAEPKTAPSVAQPAAAQPSALAAQSTASKPAEPAKIAERPAPRSTQAAEILKAESTPESATKPATEEVAEQQPALAPERSTTKPASDATQVASAAAPDAAPKAEKGKGGVRIQVASLPSEDAAWAAWKQISKDFSDQVSGLTASIETADLGQQGTFYRLQTGPFDTVAAAKDRCAKMKESGLDCIVVGKE